MTTRRRMVYELRASSTATAAVVVTRAAQLGLTAAFVLELQKNREAIGRDSELRPEGAF